MGIIFWVDYTQDFYGCFTNNTCGSWHVQFVYHFKNLLLRIESHSILNCFIFLRDTLLLLLVITFEGKTLRVELPWPRIDNAPSGNVAKYKWTTQKTPCKLTVIDKAIALI